MSLRAADPNIRRGTKSKLRFVVVVNRPRICRIGGIQQQDATHDLRFLLANILAQKVDVGLHILVFGFVSGSRR